MSKHQNKYSLLIKSNQVEEEELLDKKKKTARYLLSIAEQGSIWLRIENLKYLSLYADMDFVQKGLIDIYRRSNNEKIRKTIKEIHTGDLDISDIIEFQKQYKEMKNELDQAEEEYKMSLDQEMKSIEDTDSTDLKCKRITANY